MTSWEYQRKHSDLWLWFQPCSARGCTCLWTFFNQILAKIFEWKLVVCQLKQKNLELSCLYMKGELLAIDKDSNKTYLCTVVPLNMARLYWIILKCYYLLSCTDGGYAKDYLLKIHLVRVSLHICNSNTCRVFLYCYYWTGNINFFGNVVLHGIFLNWEPELCHNLQNLLNLQKFPWYTVCTISYFNSLTPKILIEILLTVCHTILVMLVWRIWYWINLLSPNWYFSLFLSLVWLILY